MAIAQIHLVYLAQNWHLAKKGEAFKEFLFLLEAFFTLAVPLL